MQEVVTHWRKVQLEGVFCAMRSRILNQHYIFLFTDLCTFFWPFNFVLSYFVAGKGNKISPRSRIIQHDYHDRMMVVFHDHCENIKLRNSNVTFILTFI